MTPQPQGWEEEFDRLGGDDLLEDPDIEKENLPEGHLTRGYCWPETKHELDPESVKDFIRELLAQKEAEKRALVEEMVAGVRRSFYQKIIGGTVIELFCTEKDILTTLTAIAEKHGITPNEQ